MLSAAVAQFSAGTDKAQNLDTACALIRSAAEAGARLVVLPECAMHFDPTPGADIAAHAEPLDGDFGTALAHTAKEAGVHVVAGMTETIPDDSRAYNTVVVVDPNGERIGVYRKIHLYDAFGYRESDRIRPADHAAPLVFDLDGIRFSTMTCYDLRFPETARTLADAGATAVVLPAAWAVGPAKEEHWSTLVRARAIENTSYVLACGQTGPECTGQSTVVDPMGTVLAGAGEAPGIAVASLDPERIAQVREKNPSLANRRFTVAPRPR
jgi:deaminated glutathione amidase